MLDVIESIEVLEGEGKVCYMMVNDVVGLVVIVQMGVLELYVWGVIGWMLDKLDWVVFDFDLVLDVFWVMVVEGVQLVWGLFDEFGLDCFFKIFGGKGLYVMLFICLEYDWDVIKDWVYCLVVYLVCLLLDCFIVCMSKVVCIGKIFIDYLCNVFGVIMVVVYLVCVCDGVLVLVLIIWEELEQGVQVDYFWVFIMLKRLESLFYSDFWVDFNKFLQCLMCVMLDVFDLV